MATLRVFRGEIPVAEIDLPAGGARIGASPGDDLRSDLLGLHPDRGGRIQKRDGRWIFLADGAEAGSGQPLSGAVPVAFGDGFIEVVEPAGPVLDLAALPADDPPPATPAPSRPGPASARLGALEAVLEASDAGRGAADVLAAAHDAAMRAVDAPRGFAGLLEADGTTLRVAAARALDARDPRSNVSRHVVDSVLQEGKDVLAGDAPSELPRTSVVAKGIRSICAVPIRLGGRVAGILYLDAGASIRAFSTDDLALLRVLAALVSRRLDEDERRRRQEEERRALAGRLAARDSVEEADLAWNSPSMRRVRDEAERLARAFRGRSLPVLISGETGTGKEVLARWLHERVEGGRGRFVAVNCAAIPHELAESELFGIEQGVATGVLKRLGKFQQADGGTLFLDEVGEMDLAVQGKLLRALETRRIQRVGGREDLAVDVRVVSATNRPLPEAIRAGRFREDLYWRLCGVELHMPPLKDRREDLPTLARGFLARFAREYGVAVEDFSEAAMEGLLGYAWPGNVRELRQRVGAMVVLARGKRIEVQDLPPAITGSVAPASAEAFALRSLADVEDEHIRRVIEACGGDMNRAAEVLGVHRKTLSRRAKRDAEA